MIDNVQLIKYDRFFATGSDAVQGGRRSACRITFSSPLAIRGGGLANDWRRLCPTPCIYIREEGVPRGGTPYVMGDTYVPRFWPPFFTLAGWSTIFLGYFFSSTNTKTIFWGIKTTNSYRIRSFRPQISFFPRSFWVQFSAASGTPPSFFGPSTPPGGVSRCYLLWYRILHANTAALASVKSLYMAGVGPQFITL